MKLDYRIWDDKNKKFYYNENPIDGDVELFTGFYDKNGKKIYEGDIIIFNDIIHDTNRIGVIIKRHSGEFRLEFSKNDTLGLKILNESELLVIGNIHENMNLLKDEE